MISVEEFLRKPEVKEPTISPETFLSYGQSDLLEDKKEALKRRKRAIWEWKKQRDLWWREQEDQRILDFLWKRRYEEGRHMLERWKELFAEKALRHIKNGGKIMIEDYGAKNDAELYWMISVHGLKVYWL